MAATAPLTSVECSAKAERLLALAADADLRAHTRDNAAAYRETAKTWARLAQAAAIREQTAPRPPVRASR